VNCGEFRASDDCTFSIGASTVCPILGRRRRAGRKGERARAPTSRNGFSPRRLRRSDRPGNSYPSAQARSRRFSTASRPSDPETFVAEAGSPVHRRPRGGPARPAGSSATAEVDVKLVLTSEVRGIDGEREAAGIGRAVRSGPRESVARARRRRNSSGHRAIGVMGSRRRPPVASGSRSYPARQRARAELRIPAPRRRPCPRGGKETEPRSAWRPRRRPGRQPERVASDEGRKQSASSDRGGENGSEASQCHHSWRPCRRLNPVSYRDRVPPA
jgi:hypothetical protein